MKVKLDTKGENWVELEAGSKDPDSVYVDGKLMERLDYIETRLLKKNWDVVIVVDGIEGSGKSTLAIQIGWLMSYGKLSIENMIIGLEDAPIKLEKGKSGDIFIMDEGSLSFSSKEVMKREQVELIKIFNVIRQKNLILIIVAPSFFDLNRYIAVHRSRCLIHVYTDKELNRGRFAYFNQKRKNILYSEGKKNYNSYAKPEANMFGTYTNWNPLGDEYIKTKEKSLFEAFNTTKKKVLTEKDIIMKLAKRFEKQLPEITKKDLALGLGIDPKTLRGYIKTKDSVGNMVGNGR
tara:strand:+ start:2130 stop:3005 length:876 start_codon:yes stop_codon:yes gene_type:complete